MWKPREFKTVDYKNLEPAVCPVCEVGKSVLYATRPDGGKITRCGSCGHFYLNPTLPMDVLKVIYEEDYLTDFSEEEWIRMCEAWCSDPSAIYQKGLSAADVFLNKTELVIEIGCGIGSFLDQLQKRGYRVMGIEPSAKAARIAREKYHLEIMEGYAQDIASDEKTGLCGGIFSFEVIEHVVLPRAFIRQCARWLRPGGTLVISTPNFRMYEKLGRYYLDVDRQEHIQFFTPETLRALLSLEGFEVVEMTLTQAVFPGELWQKKLTPRVSQSGLWQALRRFESVQRLKRFILLSLNRRGEAAGGVNADGMNILVVAKKKDSHER